MTSQRGRHTLIGFVIAAALFAAACEQKSISQIKAEPERYSNKEVAVVGHAELEQDAELPLPRRLVRRLFSRLARHLVANGAGAFFGQARGADDALPFGAAQRSQAVLCLCFAFAGGSQTQLAQAEARQFLAAVGV